MIDILVFRNQHGDIYRVRTSGHSGFDEIGRDIVCSAVSAIIQTAVIGLKEVLKIEPLYSQKSGLAKLEIPSGFPVKKVENINIILETMLLGLKSVEIGYGEYINIQERRVE